METEKHDTVNIVSLVSIFEEGGETTERNFRANNSEDGTEEGWDVEGWTGGEMSREIVPKEFINFL